MSLFGSLGVPAALTSSCNESCTNECGICSRTKWSWCPFGWHGAKVSAIIMMKSLCIAGWLARRKRTKGNIYVIIKRNSVDDDREGGERGGGKEREGQREQRMRERERGGREKVL